MKRSNPEPVGVTAAVSIVTATVIGAVFLGALGIFLQVTF